LGSGGPTTVAALGAAPMMSLGMGADAPAYDTPRPYGTGYTFWTEGFGSWGTFDGNGNAATASRTLGGFLSGVDAALAENWRAGLATGYTQTSVDVNARLSSADIDSYNLVGYAGGGVGGLALRGAAAWSWHGIDSARAVSFPGFFEYEQASYNGDTAQVFGEAALPFATGATALEPFAGLAYVRVSTGGFAESGAVAGLNAPGSSDDLGYLTLGGRAATLLRFDGLLVTPRVSLAWQHAFGDVAPAAALAFNANGIGFGITGVPIAQDAALVEAGLDVALAPDASLSVSYQGQLAGDIQDNGIRGNLDWRF
jgi:outer membrane autotransporter protein